MKGLFGQDVEPIATEKRKHIRKLNKESRKKYSRSLKGKSTVKLYRQTSKCKATVKRWLHTEKGKAYVKKNNLRHRTKSPNHDNAIRAVRNAILHAKLLPISLRVCLYCEGQAEQYHHYIDYEPEHWLDVIPTCKKCHFLIEQFYLQENHVKFTKNPKRH